MDYYFSYYPNSPALTIPDANLIGVYGPIDHPPTDRDQLLKASFANPVNSAPLHKLVTPEDHVLIVVDDALEPTPVVFPFFYVVSELHAAGLKDSQISVLIANANHRTNTPQEVDRLIGAEMRRRLKVYQSALNTREESWHEFGLMHHTNGSLSITADSRLNDATFVIGIAGTYPNRFKGFTGGKSLILPGVGDPEMLRALYLDGAKYPSAEVFGHIEAPTRQLIRDLTQFLPSFRFCVEIVIDRTLQISSCITGLPQSTYAVSADSAHRYFTVPIPERADIVVADAHPFDHNLFQAAHAIFSAMAAVREGGELIIVSPLLEALSAESAALASWMKESRPKLLEYSEHGHLTEHGALGPIMAALKEAQEFTSKITIVPYGHGESDVERFGFHRESSVQAALDAAFSRLGADAKVTLLTHASLVVPQVG